jgi:hypothetical protein
MNPVQFADGQGIDAQRFSIKGGQRKESAHEADEMFGIIERRFVIRLQSAYLFE